MVVLVVEKASASVRGELSRWLIEPKAGIFVGNLSAMVRDKLWEKVISGVGRGKMAGALLLHSAQNEQGFSVRSFGETGRDIRDFDGLTLVFVSRKSSGRSVSANRAIIEDSDVVADITDALQPTEGNVVAYGEAVSDASRRQ